MKGERIYVCVGICVSVDKHSIQYYICYKIEIKIIIVVEYHIVISYNSSFFFTIMSSLLEENVEENKKWKIDKSAIEILDW